LPARCPRLHLYRLRIAVLPHDAILRLPERAPYALEALVHVRLRSDCFAGGLSFRAEFDIETALYAAVIEPLRDPRACPPGCCCPRCRCSSYFSLPLYPEG